MLKLRVLTALIVAPILIALTLYLDTPAFTLVVAAIFGLGAWEWASLAGLDRVVRFGYAASLAVGCGLAGCAVQADTPVLAIALGLGLVWWAVAFVFVLFYPRGAGVFTDSRLTRALAGILVLVPAAGALVWLHSNNPFFALLIMVLVSFADIAAYFSGRAFGRNKLAPRVSPGKTWEGLGGALAITIGVGVVAASVLNVPSENAAVFVVLCLVTVLVSVLGDLVESLFKRMAGAKDSGGLLPGHGGILDRIDSVTAAAPVFAAGLLWFGMAA